MEVRPFQRLGSVLWMNALIISLGFRSPLMTVLEAIDVPSHTLVVRVSDASPSWLDDERERERERERDVGELCWFLYYCFMLVKVVFVVS